MGSCIVPDCAIHGQHLSTCGDDGACDCCCHRGGAFVGRCDMQGEHGGDGCGPHQPTEDCRGCLPWQAIPGLHVCAGCETRIAAILDGLATLWVDLAEHAASGSIVSGGGGGTEAEACPDCDNGHPCDRMHRPTPSPLSEGPIVARSTIRAHLVTWCVILRDKHHITLPDETHIVAQTRRLAMWESSMAAQERLASDLCRLPSADGSPPDMDGYRQHRDAYHARLRAAEQHRTDRETGRDVLAHLAGHIHRHMECLLADPDDAPVLIGDLREALTLGRKYANRTPGRNLRVPCPSCGARVHLAPDDQAQVTCPACGMVADQQAWGARPAVPMAEDEIVEYLASHHRMRVTGVLIRQWATRGKIGRLKQGGTVMYNPVEVAAYALQRRAEQAS